MILTSLRQLTIYFLGSRHSSPSLLRELLYSLPPVQAFRKMSSNCHRRCTCWKTYSGDHDCKYRHHKESSACRKMIRRVGTCYTSSCLAAPYYLQHTSIEQWIVHGYPRGRTLAGYLGPRAACRESKTGWGASCPPRWSKRNSVLLGGRWKLQLRRRSKLRWVPRDKVERKSLY